MLLGRSDDARGHYQEALELCQKIRFRPELALVRLDLGELLLAHYPRERAAALEHLDAAAVEFRDMHMQPGLERALGLMETTQPPLSSRPSHPAASDGLTTREREVAALVATGLSNRDIGKALVIAEGTAEVHVKHILSKLGFRSRSQVAVWATQQGLASGAGGGPGRNSADA